MATFNNNLRIKEIATGAEAGSWGTSTNTNLSLIGDALGYATEATFDTDANKTVTVGDATASPYRSMYVKVTSSTTLSTSRDLTIGPNTIKRVMFLENSTTGGQAIVIKQGSGSSVSIPNGAVMCVYLDGAGAGAAVVSVFTDFVMQDSVKISGTTPTLTLGDGDAEDAKIVYNGNGLDYYIGLDDSSDKLVIGDGSTVGSNSILSIEDNTLTIGDGSEIDAKLIFDGNSQDFHIGLDDSEDDLVIGTGTTLGAAPNVYFKNEGGVQIRSDGPSNRQLTLVDHTDTYDRVLMHVDSGAFKMAAQQDLTTLGSIVLQGINNSTTIDYGTFNSSGISTGLDIEVTTNSSTRSVILRSPNGTRYRINVDNSGNLSTTAV